MVSLRARPGRVSSSLDVSVRGVSSDATHALDFDARSQYFCIRHGSLLVHNLSSFRATELWDNLIERAEEPRVPGRT